MSPQANHSGVSNKDDRLSSLGFRFGKSSVHTSRTMMLAELAALLEASSPAATKEAYFRDVIEDNVLGKTTFKARMLTAERLAQLYLLDDGICLFRVFRHCWNMDDQSRCVLALLCALSRDSLLRLSAEHILRLPKGARLTTAAMVSYLEAALPGRFSSATITSLAQNINSSWTQAGYLTGKVHKKRSQPPVTPAAVVFALVLAYLEGDRAQRLFDSFWVKCLGLPKGGVYELAIAAAQCGWMDFRQAGDIIDVRFPDLLTDYEQELIREQA